MSFRRIPFQFSTTDPAERQRELEKRFGVPSENKMYVDAANPLTMGSGFNTSTSSPRFQHRVPMFVDGKSSQSSVDSLAGENKTPRVRVIPIEIEKDETSQSSRHRTFSGPAEISKARNKDMCSQRDDGLTLKRSMGDLSKPSKMKLASGPRVYNVPIKVEQSAEKEKKTKSKREMPEIKSPLKVNGCNISKKSEPESFPKEKEVELTEKERMEMNINNSLKKIDSVLEELKPYETGVNEFNGTAKDKQYRYLDEMLTRCMIKLDDVETFGNEEVRSARKKVVRMVQACIDLLESKVNITESPDSSTNTNLTKNEAVEKQDNSEQPAVMDEKSHIENQLVINTDESEQLQIDSLTQERMLENLSDCKPEINMKNDVPEVEMAEVTSTSGDESQKEETDIHKFVTDETQSDVINVISDKVRLPSDTNEIEMMETTQVDLQDEKKLPKPEVSSTNNESDVINVSMCNKSFENQKVIAIPEDSSSNISKSVSSNLDEFPAETVSEHCDIMENVKTEDAEDNSNYDSNLVSSVPEFEMKETVENSCETDNTILDKQCNLLSNCNNEPN